MGMPHLSMGLLEVRFKKVMSVTKSTQWNADVTLTRQAPPLIVEVSVFNESLFYRHISADVKLVAWSLRKYFFILLTILGSGKASSSPEIRSVLSSDINCVDKNVNEVAERPGNTFFKLIFFFF